MNTRYKITITERECADGVRGNERLCVVATAIARLEPNATRIEVNVNTIRFSFKGEDGKTYRFAFPTPAVVRDYIRRFDDGAEPEPMTFVLDHPEIVEKPPRPAGIARTVSFKPQGAPKSHRVVRVFGEKSYQPVNAR